MFDYRLSGIGLDRMDFAYIVTAPETPFHSVECLYTRPDFCTRRTQQATSVRFVMMALRRRCNRSSVVRRPLDRSPIPNRHARGRRVRIKPFHNYIIHCARILGLQYSTAPCWLSRPQILTELWAVARFPTPHTPSPPILSK